MSEGTYSEVKDKSSENEASIILLNNGEESKLYASSSKSNKMKEMYGTESIDFNKENLRSLRKREEKKDGN